MSQLKFGAFYSILIWGIQFLTCPCVAQDWRTLASLPQYTLQEHSTITITSQRIATIGGLINIGQWGTTTDLVQLYDIPSNSWSRGPRLPVALNHPNAVTVGGRVYVLGGLTGGSGWPATAGSWAFNPSTNIWSTLPSMPSNQARGAAAIGVYNNVIYLAGGIASLNSPSATTVSAFDTLAGRWISLPAAAQNIPEPRDHVGGAVVGSKFYVVGGRDTGIANVKDSVYVLDLLNSSAGWTTSSARLPTARAGHSIAAWGSRIYTFGGEGSRAASSGVFPQVEVLETSTNTWTSLAPMPRPRHGTSAAVVNGNIYIPGGGITEGVGATNHFDLFAVSGNPQTTTTTRQMTQGTTMSTTTLRQMTQSSSACSSAWGQCGGLSWTGATCCMQGTCRAQNQWYSQCIQ